MPQNLDWRKNMPETTPQSAQQNDQALLGRPWSDIQAQFQALMEEPLSSSNVERWLADWTAISDLISETYARLSVATTLDTTDREAEARYNQFLDKIFPHAQAGEQQLKQKLLSSGLEPAGMQVPLRKMRTEAALFREANLPLLIEERKQSARYNKIIGAQTVIWEERELTLQQLRQVFYQPGRERREHAWRLAAERQLADRQVINELWEQMLQLRVQMAENAGQVDYRTYRWQQLLRLDYTPEDCYQFQAAIEQVAVPAATRIYEKHRQRLGVDRLRPWDLDQDLYPVTLPPISPYGTSENLIATAEIIFRKVDPQLGEYFHLMRHENLLDVENTKGKAPGAYCTYFPVAKRPYIFANSVGLFADVRTIMHESGHAFHNFEISSLPYAQQRRPGLEFSEVASMSMELLSSPYWAKSEGGYYSEADTRQARISHLERNILFWPYMAVVDAFQHWVYTHPEQAAKPANCDNVWLDLWERFMPGVDWSGLEDAAATGWHRKQHIHRAPLYYFEYGIAQLGATLVWRYALQDQKAAVAAYRQALAMGGTATLPELYATAGARFAFDTDTLKEAVGLVEQVMADLENE
jgi:oligoendopeptidase F